MKQCDFADYCMGFVSICGGICLLSFAIVIIVECFKRLGK